MEVLIVNQMNVNVYFAGVQVTECRLVVDPRTRESRGFGFVTMETAEDADRCIKYLNRSTLEGRIITVEKVSLESHIYLLPYFPSSLMKEN
jgi:transformer-2 protein